MFRSWVICIFIIGMGLPSLFAQTDSASTYDLYFLIDRSPSMGYALKSDDGGRSGAKNSNSLTKLEGVRSELLKLVEDTSLPLGTEIKIFTFDEVVQEIGSVTLNGIQERETAKTWLRSIKLAPRGRTSLWKCINEVLEISRKNAIRNRRKTKVLIFSDGETTDPTDIAPLESVGNVSLVEPVLVTLGWQLQEESQRVWEKIGEVRSPKSITDLIPILIDYQWKPEKPCVGEKVTFENLTTNCDSVRWTICGKVYEDKSAPFSLSFSRAGVFPVKLEVTRGSSSNTLQRELTILPPPEILARDQVNVGEPFDLFSRCTGSVSDYQWLLEGVVKGHEADLRNVVLEKTGKYLFTLRVKGTDGEFQQEKSITAVQVVPKAMFYCENRVYAGEKIVVVDQSKGPIDSIHYRFTDGAKFEQESDDPNPTFMSNTPGEYTITQTVQNSQGKVTAKKTVSILPSPPRAEILTRDQVNVGEPFDLFSRCTGHISNYQWLLDGENKGQEADLRNVVLEKPGEHLFTLHVKGVDGEFQLEKSVTVVQAQFHCEDKVYAGEKIVVVDQSKGPIDSIHYRFTDGAAFEQMSDDPNPTFVSDTPGKYTITQTVQNSQGERTVEKSIDILPWDAPVVKLTPMSGVYYADTEVRLTAIVNGNTERIVWETGEDDAKLVEQPYENGGYAEYVHAYKVAKTYTVSCMVEGRGGTAKDSCTLTVIEQESRPQADFTLDPEEDRLEEDNHTVTIHGQNSSVGKRFVWDFGDGTPPITKDTHEKVSHEYRQPGTYIVSLTAESGGKFPVSVTTKTVTILPPLTFVQKNLLWLILGGVVLAGVLAGVIVGLKHLKNNALRGTLYWGEEGHNSREKQFKHWFSTQGMVSLTERYKVKIKKEPSLDGTNAIYKLCLYDGKTEKYWVEFDQDNNQCRLTIEKEQSSPEWTDGGLDGGLDDGLGLHGNEDDVNSVQTPPASNTSSVTFTFTFSENA